MLRVADRATNHSAALFDECLYSTFFAVQRTIAIVFRQKLHLHYNYFLCFAIAPQQKCSFFFFRFLQTESVVQEIVSAILGSAIWVVRRSIASRCFHKFYFGKGHHQLTQCLLVFLMCTIWNANSNPIANTEHVHFAVSCPHYCFLPVWLRIPIQNLDWCWWAQPVKVSCHQTGIERWLHYRIFRKH